MTAVTIISLLPWVGSLLQFVAGLLITFPALRFSRHQRTLERLRLAEPKSESLDSLRQYLLERTEAGLDRWERRDHVMLVLGLAAFILGSLAQLCALVAN